MSKSKNEGQTWPEQEIIDAWFRRHSMELKEGVSGYRIRLSRQIGELEDFLREKYPNKFTGQEESPINMAIRLLTENPKETP